jgi:hypothetical protein
MELGPEVRVAGGVSVVITFFVFVPITTNFPVVASVTAIVAVEFC